MEQEEKQLLLKDLCARLPYGVMADCGGEFAKIKYIEPSRSTVYISILGKTKWESIEVIAPYLRPMSSMTEEEFVHFMALRGRNLSSYDIRLCMKKAFNMPNFITIVSPLYNYLRNIEWLLSKHFDVHGLIEKNLAIEVTEENNPYKE